MFVFFVVIFILILIVVYVLKGDEFFKKGVLIEGVLVDYYFVFVFCILVMVVVFGVGVIMMIEVVKV